MSFELDGHLIEAIRLTDDWSNTIPNEEFGFAALASFHLYRAQTPQEESVLANLALPPSAAADLTGRIVELSSRVVSLLNTPADTRPARHSIETFADSRRHFVVSAVGGNPTLIEVNLGWLRVADTSEIETDLADALNAAIAAGVSDSKQEPYHARAEYDAIMQVLNDYAEYPK